MAHPIATSQWCVSLSHRPWTEPTRESWKDGRSGDQGASKVVEHDWIPDDQADGGLQFDNGLCGKALVSAWQLTRDDRYLAAAKRAGDWTISRPLVTNWNYNAFSVGLLARLAEVTQDNQREKYLAAAIKKAEVGVLPGQMESGRWFDAHNACAVYHNILMRELLELLTHCQSTMPLDRRCSMRFIAD